MQFTKFEVSPMGFKRIKKHFHNYVFNRAENGKYFVKLSNSQKREVLKKGIALIPVEDVK